MSLPEKLGTEFKAVETNQEIVRLEEAESALLSRARKISVLLNSLLDGSEDLADFKVKKQQLDSVFFADQEAESDQGVDKLVAVKEKLKQELPGLDLKFSGGKKGAKSNRELAVEKITAYLESLQAEINNLDQIKEGEYLQTPAGQEGARIKTENKIKCQQEVSANLSRWENLAEINELKISPRHLELAGVYGVELTQETILAEWKTRATELLLNQDFAESKNKIKNFAEAKSFTENFSDHNEKFKAVKESAANLKTVEDQTVLILADIIAQNPEVKEKLYNYGIRGASLSVDIKKMLTAYDDLTEDKIADSPAALAYEYLHHLLHVSAGSGSNNNNPVSDFENLFYFRGWEDKQHSAADVFGQKYVAADFNFFNRADYNPDFLVSYSDDLIKLLSALQKELQVAGKEIDPKMFLANFGQKNYDIIKALPDLSSSEAKITNFSKEYVKSENLNNRHYEDAAIFNKFDILNKQAQEKLAKLLPLRWLEEELTQKYQKYPEVWETLNNKIKLADYLKFLEQNKEYHLQQPITVDTDNGGKIGLLDRTNRQAEIDKKMEYEAIEAEYKDYLKNRVTTITSTINQTEGRLFNKKEKLRVLNKRLGTCQVLSSHSLADKIQGRITSPNLQEQFLTPVELATVQHFLNQGYANWSEQEKIRKQYELTEKDLNRYQDKLDSKFLSDYPNLLDYISTYESLIANLKLVNVGLSSLLREKYSSLIKDFTAKSKQYKELVADYNRRYNRAGSSHAIAVINFRDDLADYL